MEQTNKNDLMIFLANFIFIISLFPSILSKDKPNWATSLLQVCLAFLYIYVYRNLKFRLAFTANVIIGVLWLILFLQKAFF
jgi:hypothetical protein